jgi:hypothetical protein
VIDEDEVPPASQLHSKNPIVILEQVDNTEGNDEDIVDEITEITEEEELSKRVNLIAN